MVISRAPSMTTGHKSPGLGHLTRTQPRSGPQHRKRSVRRRYTEYEAVEARRGRRGWRGAYGGSGMGGGGGFVGRMGM